MMGRRGWISDEAAGALFVLLVFTPAYTVWRAWKWLRTGA
jgi:hypothetical protein